MKSGDYDILCIFEQSIVFSGIKKIYIKKITVIRPSCFRMHLFARNSVLKGLNTTDSDDTYNSADFIISYWLSVIRSLLNKSHKYMRLLVPCVYSMHPHHTHRMFWYLHGSHSKLCDLFTWVIVKWVSVPSPWQTYMIYVIVTINSYDYLLEFFAQQTETFA